MTNAQKRRLVTQLKADPPGFSETTLTIADTHACVTSVLRDPSVVDTGFLTAYRRCALVEMDDATQHNTGLLRDGCPTISDLGNSGIATLLDENDGLAILRLLDFESYSVVQLIGPPAVEDPATQCLLRQGVRQFHDIGTLSQEIAGLRE